MKSPRLWALDVKLPYCDRQCAGDALLCVPHAAIEAVIEQAVKQAAAAAFRWTE